MGKKITKVEDTIVSVAKALPLIGGAMVGLMAPAKGAAASPIGFMRNGNWDDATKSLISNYTFMNGWQGTFDLGEGKGAKGLIVGYATSKLISWMAE
jgi:hypothetical protein